MFEPGKLKEIVGEPGLRPLEAKADPFSLDSLIAWLEKQPGETHYNFYQYDECLWGLYTAANGGGLVDEAYHLNGCRMDARGREMPIRQVQVAVEQPWTISAALSRARALRDAP